MNEQVTLGVSHNNCGVHEPCNLCGQDHKPPCGFIVALEGPGHRFVCDVCAIKHDPRLWTLVQLGLQLDELGSSSGMYPVAVGTYFRRQTLIEKQDDWSDPDFPKLLFTPDDREAELIKRCDEYLTLRQHVLAIGRESAARQNRDMDIIDLWRWIEEQRPVTDQAIKARSQIMALSDWCDGVKKEEQEEFFDWTTDDLVDSLCAIVSDGTPGEIPEHLKKHFARLRSWMLCRDRDPLPF
jgi:hypothetical protein